MPILPLAFFCLLAAFPALFAPALAGEPFPPAFAAAGRTLAEPAVEEAILAALAERRVNVAGATLEISGMSARGAIPGNATLVIERIAYQPAGQRFTAVLGASTAGQQPAQRFTVAGRLRQGDPGAGPQPSPAGGRGDHRGRSAMGLGRGPDVARQRRL